MDSFSTSVSNAMITPDDLIGTWRLLSVSSWREGHLVDSRPYGENPVGFLHYLPGGRMSVIISYGQRQLLKGDRLNAPIDERAHAYASLIAYAGTYRLSGDSIVHQIEVSAFQNEVGTEQVRYFAINGSIIFLTTVPLSRGGIATSYKLEWERVAK